MFSLIPFSSLILTSRIAHISRDGRDLVVLSEKRRVLFIRNFERICRGETTFERAGHVLNIQPEDICSCLGFEHVRVSQSPFVVARVHVGLQLQGLYIFTYGPDLSAKAAFVRSSLAGSRPIGCMQLTDHRMFFTWEDRRRREDIPMLEDAGNALELPPPPTEIPSLDLEFGLPPWLARHSGYSFMTSVPLSAGCVFVYGSPQRV